MMVFHPVFCITKRLNNSTNKQRPAFDTVWGDLFGDYFAGKTSLGGGTGGTSPRFCTRLPPPSRSGPKAPRGGGGGGGGALEGGGSGRGDGGGGGREGQLGGGVQVGQFGVVGGGAQAPVTSPCPPSGVRARARVTELVEPVLVL